MEYGYPKGHVFYRKLTRAYPMAAHGEGIYLYDESGKRDILMGPEVPWVSILAMVKKRSFRA